MPFNGENHVFIKKELADAYQLEIHPIISTIIAKFVGYVFESNKESAYKLVIAKEWV
jgi:hypothetical protein